MTMVIMDSLMDSLDKRIHKRLHIHLLSRRDNFFKSSEGKSCPSMSSCSCGVCCHTSFFFCHLFSKIFFEDNHHLWAGVHRQFEHYSEGKEGIVDDFVKLVSKMEFGKACF